jgi:AraC-like DNA-binding protein
VTDFEKLEGKVAALIRRIEVLERQHASALAGSADDLAAQRVAQEMGFNAEVVQLCAASVVRLEKELRGKGWSMERIARVLKCSERTVRRHLACPDRDRVDG